MTSADLTWRQSDLRCFLVDGRQSPLVLNHFGGAPEHGGGQSMPAAPPPASPFPTPSCPTAASCCRSALLTTTTTRCFSTALRRQYHLSHCRGQLRRLHCRSRRCYRRHPRHRRHSALEAVTRTPPSRPSLSLPPVGSATRPNCVSFPTADATATPAATATAAARWVVHYPLRRHPRRQGALPVAPFLGVHGEWRLVWAKPGGLREV